MVATQIFSMFEPNLTNIFQVGWFSHQKKVFFLVPLRGLGLFATRDFDEDPGMEIKEDFDGHGGNL